MPMNQGQTGVRNEVDLHLRASMDSDGAVRVDGVIRISPDTLRPAIAQYAPAIIAAHQTADTACADADSDGRPEVVRLAADFRHVKSGDRVPVVLTTPGQELEASGTYRIVVEIDGAPITVEARVRVGRDRLPRGR